MKRTIFLLSALLILVGCNDPGENSTETTSQASSFVLEGTAPGVPNGMRAYLKMGQGSGNQQKVRFLDTAIVMNERFTLTSLPDVADGDLQYLSIDGVKGNLRLIKEPTTVKLQVNRDNLDTSEFQTGDWNKELQEFRKEERLMVQPLEDLKRKMQLAQVNQDEELKNYYTNLGKDLQRKRMDLIYKYVDKNTDNPMGMKFLITAMQSDGADVVRVREAYEKQDEKYQKSYEGSYVFDTVNSQVKLAIGAPAPAFTAPTPTGEQLSLSDALGKVTVIDFWASWCGPCRRENPNVVRMYNKYHDKGLNIVGVSLDKQNMKDKWIKAIQDDQLEWQHVSNLAYFQDPIAREYKISSIPATYILDADGNIAAKNLRGQALEDKVAELLAK